MSNTRLIVLEFNELTPSLMHRFIAEGKLPNFARLFWQSEIFTTVAAERPPHLDPWIQWVTVHTGLNLCDHKIERLNEGHTLQAPRVWDIVSDGGDRVLVFGSMNVGERRPAKGCVLPDPWTTKVAPHPQALAPFFEFVQRNVLEHTRDRAPFGAADCVRLGAFMAAHGLSRATITAILRQLLEERRGQARWKRAVLLDKLQFDVFRWYYRRLQPKFATFFVNSTAHYQHLYWREMDPSPFAVQPTDAERATHAAAIEFGYRQMDTIVGETLRMADGNTVIAMATALSQQPCLAYEGSGGKHFYRPRTFERLLSLVGITAPHVAAPVMAHQFHLYFNNEAQAEAAAGALARVHYGGRQAISIDRVGNGVFGGCRVYERVPADGVLTIGDQRVPFSELFYRVDAVKSGMHHPEGMLWIRTPARHHEVRATPVPLNAVAPTLLDLSGIERPAYMPPSLFSAEPAHAVAV